MSVKFYEERKRAQGELAEQVACKRGFEERNNGAEACTAGDRAREESHGMEC